MTGCPKITYCFTTKKMSNIFNVIAKLFNVCNLKGCYLQFHKCSTRKCVLNDKIIRYLSFCE